MRMPATTLEDAYNELDPRQAITYEQLTTLFVEREHSPTAEMAMQLRVSRRHVKLLFVGHRGAGKSSELTYLASLIEAQFLTVPVPLYDIFKSPAVSHTEVVFAMLLRLLQKATTEGLIPQGLITKVWDDLLERSYTFFKRLLFGESPIPADQQNTVTLKVNVLAAELEAKIGTESYTRAQVKEKFEGRVNEMLEQITDLARQLESKLDKRLLLVVEDLDKFDLDDTRRLFLEHARTLTAPYPGVIYSFPVAMRYSNEYPEIKKGFDEAYLLPNVALKHRDGSAEERGPETMRQILVRRAATPLFEPGVIDQIVALSGGHVKSLIQLAQQAVLRAIVARRQTVSLDQVKQTAAALRDDYASLLSVEQIQLLRQQCDDTDKDLLGVTPEVQALLFNGSLLEYRNTRGPWGDANPMVVDLLKRDWA